MRPPDRLPSARYERFESHREYEDRFDALIPRAVEVIRVFERRLGPRYNSAHRSSLLRDFLRGAATRRLLVVVHEADTLARDCPRLIELAVGHEPRVQLRRTLASVRHAHNPVVIVDMTHYLHRFHYTSMRAAQGLDDLQGAQPLLDRHAELWAASTPVPAAGPAGL